MNEHRQIITATKNKNLDVFVILYPILRQLKDMLDNSDITVHRSCLIRILVYIAEFAKYADTKFGSCPCICKTFTVSSANENVFFGLCHIEKLYLYSFYKEKENPEKVREDLKKRIDIIIRRYLDDVDKSKNSPMCHMCGKIVYDL
jgi:hypothetical protein